MIDLPISTICIDFSTFSIPSFQSFPSFPSVHHVFCINQMVLCRRSAKHWFDSAGWTLWGPDFCNNHRAPGTSVMLSSEFGEITFSTSKLKLTPGVVPTFQGF